MTDDARISRGRIGLIAWVLAHGGGRQARSGPLNLFLTLGRHRKLFRGWIHFAGRLMPGGSLPRRESELVILRVAHLRACAYEQAHHVRLGRRAGLSTDEIERVTAGPDAAGWSSRERLLLRAVDELHSTQDLSDPTWAGLRTELSETDAIELVMLAGHYEMLATAIAALRIQPDPPRR